MALEREHLEYPRRAYGMDHDRYDWSMLTDRSPVQWPGGKRLALWVNVCLQFFPLNQKGKPFAVPGGMTMPYPDLRHFSLRDYGNRVGIYRFLKAFDRYGVRPGFAVNSALAERAPALLRTIAERGDEILAHGVHMDALHYGGQDEAEERALVTECLDTLRQASGQAVTGWLSPARNESEHTPELLVEHGVEYFCDWVNDDMPYRFHTGNGGLWAMPLSNELEDRFVIMNNLHSEQSWLEQVCDAADFLLQEAEQSDSGRILALNLHPWMLGQPHRIAKLEQALDYITGKDSVWTAPPGEILKAFREQQA
ncbi:polysaccharide deacetylase family protein [Parahaliea maris]|uniref:Polysaccharide deacetylase family protein n=1 Tax=Parahaliea maris TaxID=2716870 RepID=A0A5C8ZX31_9GAMM|nr:polysaccharide deacetylase family protein [Parahaliea maris]TXS92037.1 polysaccharide deacetylase family protein [Parahaliea maris]